MNNNQKKAEVGYANHKMKHTLAEHKTHEAKIDRNEEITFQQ